MRYRHTAIARGRTAQRCVGIHGRGLAGRSEPCWRKRGTREARRNWTPCAAGRFDRPFWRAAKALARSRDGRAISPEWPRFRSTKFQQQAQEIVSQAEKICAHHFDLLGYEGLEYGAEINWHKDVVHDKEAPRKPFFKMKYLDFDEVGDSKITWELNRHQHFVTLAKAYQLTGDERFVRELVAQWKSWHHANPYPIGMNWASSLEVAFRSLSWMWTYFLLADSPAMT